jgi:hypothetical protein
MLCNVKQNLSSDMEIFEMIWFKGIKIAWEMIKAWLTQNNTYANKFAFEENLF